MRLATVERVTATDPADRTAAPKVRVGLGLGARTALHGPEFGAVVDEMEAVGFDSLWLSERISGPAPDPIVAMSFAAGRTARLKFGMSVLVLPGRNPVVLAKELATLAVMSGGRLLPAFGLGVADGREHQAFGVQRSERAAWFDEALAVMRTCWTTRRRPRRRALPLRGPASFSPHRCASTCGSAASPRPSCAGSVASPTAGCRRSSRRPTRCRPGGDRAGRRRARAGRSTTTTSVRSSRTAATRRDDPDRLAADLHRRRPDVDDPRRLVPVGWAAVQATIRAFVDVGTTKFVLVALDEPTTTDGWLAHVREASEVASEHQDA